MHEAKNWRTNERIDALGKLVVWAFVGLLVYAVIQSATNPDARNVGLFMSMLMAIVAYASYRAGQRNPWE